MSKRGDVIVLDVGGGDAKGGNGTRINVLSSHITGMYGKSDTKGK